MKDIFNKLYRKNYSNTAIAHNIGVSVETLKKLRRMRRNLPDDLKTRLILKRANQLNKKSSNKKKVRSYE